ncbi:MAG: putative membrane protein YqiK, partial [Myxococcota bacterium]
MMLFLSGLLLGGLLTWVVLTGLQRVRWTPHSSALLVSTPQETTVHFEPLLIFRMLRRVEEIDLSVQSLAITRRGSEGLICADNIRADITAVFQVQIRRTPED